nr:MAG TPA: hypothetical protein [Caudoviricetes sp.]
MVSCRMFMLALHTIWHFCLSNVVFPFRPGFWAA